MTSHLTVVVIVRTNKDQKLDFPSVFKVDQVLNVVNEVKYLGHTSRDDLCHDGNVQQKCCSLHKPTCWHTNFLCVQMK